MKLTLIKLADGVWINPSEIESVVTEPPLPGRLPNVVVTMLSGKEHAFRHSTADTVVQALTEKFDVLVDRDGQRSVSSAGLLAVDA